MPEPTTVVANIDLVLETGRTHQARVQLAHAGELQSLDSQTELEHAA